MAPTGQPNGFGSAKACVVMVKPQSTEHVRPGMPDERDDHGKDRAHTEGDEKWCHDRDGGADKHPYGTGLRRLPPQHD